MTFNEFFDELCQPEELIVGAVFSFVVSLLIILKYFSLIAYAALLPIAIICAILWRLGGMGFCGTKLWRRLGVPIVLVLLAIAYKHQFALLSIVAWAPLAIGYGIPQTDDSPSWMGKFWAKYFETSIFWTDFFTRASCHVLTLICFIPCFI